MLNSQLLLGADFIIPGEHVQVNLMPLPLSSPAPGAVVRHGFTWHYGFQAFNRKSRRITRHPCYYRRAPQLGPAPGSPGLRLGVESSVQSHRGIIKELMDGDFPDDESTSDHRPTVLKVSF